MEIILRSYHSMMPSFSVNASHYKYSVLKRNLALRKVLRNQRVLIIGSGPSASELKDIPRDVKILTCNIGPRLLLDKGIEREIDLYYCAIATPEMMKDLSELGRTRGRRGLMSGFKAATAANDISKAVDKGHKNENIIDLLSKFKINLFILYNTKLIKKYNRFKKTYTKFIKDKASDNYYLNKLIGRQKTEEIKSHFLCNDRTSIGIRLLQYALYYKAKEIYMIGIDINEKGYFWGRDNIHEHILIDKNFIEMVSKKYDNIYSAAENSPIVRYIKYRPLL